MNGRLVTYLAFACAIALGNSLWAGNEERTIVVYNAKDAGSTDLAHFYSEKRKIPADHLVGLECAIAEEISREEYEATIEKPLRDAFDKNGWWKTTPNFEAPHPQVTENKIRYIALIRGVPLKIRASATLPLSSTLKMPAPLAGSNEACVDSELAAMGIAPYTAWGLLPNPYFRSYTAIEDANLPDLMLVARLDAPFVSTVKRMIEDAIAAEQNGLEGRAFVDLYAPGNGLPDRTVEEGNAWMSGAAEQCRKNGIPVVIERTKNLFGRGYPLLDVILYYGWYREHACGAFTDPSFHFTPGSLAIHLHSFSGQTVRDPARGWIGPLVERGVAGTIGNVYEPYLAFTPQIDVFNERLLAGFTFAESAYMSLRAVSWMNTIVGDPLYRPFARWHQIGQAVPETLWEKFRKAVVSSRIAGNADALTDWKKEAEKSRNVSMLEALALWEGNQGNTSTALRLLESARLYAEGDQADLLALVQVGILRDLGRKDAALRIIRTRLNATKGDRQSVFKEIELDLAPPPPTPAPKKQ